MKDSKGLIIKGIAGFYYVKSGESVYRCKARGVFKQRDIKPAVGDMVKIHVIPDNDDSLITEILPRRNSFIRPFIANVDCFVIVTSVARPAPVLSVIDKFLVMAEKTGTEIILCMNKCDLADAEAAKNQKNSKAAQTRRLLEEIYEPVYPVVCMDSKSGDGLEEFRELIKGKKVALAGASGVGKSTILNRLKPEATAETGSISEKSERGKHTTRHSELFTIDKEAGTMIFDTPGFTSFEILDAEEEELQHLFPEIAREIGKCRYHNCRHVAEPGCGVIKALNEGKINPNRYESYKAQLEEIKKSKQY
ncbi:MAG: ribosome small subunit-dependent GTPase A [Clostridiales bacterium]|nr:ribosome small subunit-dependent GTPase A [Clostridiales bacterium]